ncbi:MAG: 30S ribosomal protein S4 [Candidatus Spechtbacterales bacterium]
MPRHARKSQSEYGQQFGEKQGLKETYGLREKQFRGYFRRGKDPDSIIRGLEMRFDNVAYRCGFAPTRRFARQLVSHGHIQVNGRNVNLPSFSVKINDIISIHPRSVSIAPFKDLSLSLSKFEPPAWISLDKKELRATISASPKVEDPMIMASVKPIIEFYNR